MFERLYSYLEELKILCPLQIGFRDKGSPTTHGLISITESFHQSTDNSEFGSDVFIDLKKGFDSVNHSLIPLPKLHHYRIH